MIPPHAAMDLPVGVLLSCRYRIEAELGRGGMGRVVVARDSKIGRQVAIKLIVAQQATPDHLRPFAQEARAVVRDRLRSPACASLFASRR